MAVKEIIVYLCPTKVQSIEPSVDNTSRSIQQDTYGTQGDTIQLTVPLFNEDDICLVSGYDSKVLYMFPEEKEGSENTCIWGFPEIEWERGIQGAETLEFNDETGEFETVINFESRDAYITIEFECPQDKCSNCHWQYSRISAQNPIDFSFRYPFMIQVQMPATPPVGTIPDDPESTDEYVYAGPPALYTHQETQPNIAPGEIMSYYLSMKMGGNTYGQQANGVYFHTPLFTGGKVTGVSYDPALPGESVDERTARYSMEIEGQTFTNILPTDLGVHTVGSWAYVIKINQDGNGYNRTTAYGIDNALKPEDTVRICPIQFFYGPTVSLDMDKLTLDLTSNFATFESAYFTGVMKNNPGSNTSGVVDVTIPGIGVVEYSSVSIFYNCANFGTESGHAAFKEGDSVLVLYTPFSTLSTTIDSSDLKIIGFTNTVNYCFYAELEDDFVEAGEDSELFIYGGEAPFTFETLDSEFSEVEVEVVGDETTYTYVTYFNEFDPFPEPVPETDVITVTDTNGLVTTVDVPIVEKLLLDCNPTSSVWVFTSEILPSVDLEFSGGTAPYTITVTQNQTGGRFITPVIELTLESEVKWKPGNNSGVDLFEITDANGLTDTAFFGSTQDTSLKTVTANQEEPYLIQYTLRQWEETTYYVQGGTPPYTLISETNNCEDDGSEGAGAFLGHGGRSGVAEFSSATYRDSVGAEVTITFKMDAITIDTNTTWSETIYGGGSWRTGPAGNYVYKDTGSGYADIGFSNCLGFYTAGRGNQKLYQNRDLPGIWRIEFSPGYTLISGDGTPVLYTTSNLSGLSLQQIPVSPFTEVNTLSTLIAPSQTGSTWTSRVLLVIYD